MSRLVDPARENQKGSPAERDDLIQAAVAVVLREGDPESVLIVRRAEFVGDPWSGHAAFPGGRRELSDTDLAATARRETLEETDIDLALCARPIGPLPPVLPLSRNLPSISVTPFVYRVGAGVRARPASSEIVSVHWISLQKLLLPEASSTLRIASGKAKGATLKYPCYRVDGLVIWGLTYRILSSFLNETLSATPQGI